MMKEKETVFAKIIRREIPSEIVYEDELVLGFLDIHPVNFGHTLLIPKKHYQNIYELPDSILGHFFTVVKKLSTAIKKAVQADGINVVMNNEPAAGQVVFHAHVHIIPRFNNDGFKHWKGPRKYEPDEALETMQKIRDVLEKQNT